MTLSRHIKWLDSGPDKLLHARTANLQPKCCLLTWNRDRIDCSTNFVNIHTRPCSFVSSLSMVQTDPKDYGTTVQLVTSFWVYCAVPWLEATNISNTIKTELRAMQDNTCVKLRVRSHFLHKHFCILLTDDVEELMEITSKKSTGCVVVVFPLLWRLMRVLSSVSLYVLSSSRFVVLLICCKL